MRTAKVYATTGGLPLSFGAAGASRMLAGAILLGAMSFNALLAIVNAHVMPLTSAHVMLAEGLLVMAAAAIVLGAWRENMIPAVALIAGLFLFALLRGVVTGEMEPKFFRDVLIMPLFMMLGLAFAGGSLTRLVLTAHVAVFAVFVLEMAAPDLYSEIFRIQDYYIGTRGLNLEEFYDTSSELFVSATRPDERFIPFIDAPRASSLFLEPVSLGNYCSIVTAFTVACWHRLGSAARLLLPISTVLMIVGCDGRLALVTFLARLDAPDLLGLTNTLIDPAVDSGITYLILTQSLPGVILLWLFITCSGSDTTPEQVRYTHALCLYLSLSMLVSYAFLTIKTASLAWFIQGALQGTMTVRSPKGRGR
jgi:putative polymerase